MQSRAFCISCEGYSLQAEIMLAIQTMMEHCENSNHLLPQVFHDSHIPEQYTCGKTKCAYLIKFGHVPYFTVGSSQPCTGQNASTPSPLMSRLIKR